jgi:hypothetical protein
MTWKDIPWRPTSRTLRQFAACWMVFVGLLAFRVGGRYEQFVAGVALAALAGGVGLAGLIWPAAVRPLFLGLTVVTFPIGWLVSRLLLAVLFYGVFTPVGLVRRWLGRDALELRPCSDRYTYWAPKVIKDDPRRYFRPF